MPGGGEDPKVESLRAKRCLNPRPEAISDERFRESEFFDPRDLVQVKYEMVRRARVERVAVARAADSFGFSRQSFYSAAAALDEGGLQGLVPARPGPRGPRKLTEEVMVFSREALQADSSLRLADLVEVIAHRFGVRVHPTSLSRSLTRSDQFKNRNGGRRV